MSGACSRSSRSPLSSGHSDMSGFLKSSQDYEELNVIGSGCKHLSISDELHLLRAYGTVYKARDLMNAGQIVALKKVKVALTEDGIPLSTVREIALLKQLEAYQHPNIVRLLDVCHGQILEKEHQLVLFLVFEHVEQDLSSYLGKVPCFGLPGTRIRDMSFDILSGVDFLHSHRIVHRDLKPQNLLVTSSGRIKLADFGLAKTFDSEMKLTSVVVTLWYRPPEVLLGLSYNTAVDVWSAGCVLAELHTIQPLFAGSSEGDQLDRIFRVIGRPTKSEWPANIPVVSDNFPPHQPRDLSTICPKITTNAKDLIQKMLIFDPSQRLTALDCLKHPYFTEELLS